MNHYTTITRAIELIIKNKLEHLALPELAAKLQMSESHLRALFTEWVGISPQQFGRYLSLEYAKKLLADSKNSLETTFKSGLSSGGRLHDLFIDIEAMTPGEFQQAGKDVTITYSTAETPFGNCAIGSTERGICTIIFFDTDNGLALLQERWPRATLVNKLRPEHDNVRRYLCGLTPTSKIKLHLRGTNFQIKVWEALLSIPEGRASTYGALAKQIGFSGSAQAVGGAVGDNPIAYIIPCHRVLKATGEISGYRWGVERKRAMLAYEAIRQETNNV